MGNYLSLFSALHNREAGGGAVMQRRDNDEREAVLRTSTKSSLSTPALSALSQQRRQLIQPACRGTAS